MNITLRQLQIFCAIARREHVGKAAQDFGVTQSAASMALAELERQLGQPLFDRLGKRLMLNGNGRLLLPKVTDLLSRAEEIPTLLNKSGGELRIGASSTIGNYLMPQLIGLFSQSAPDIRISLQVGNTNQIIQAVLNFDIDLGYIEGSCCHPDLQTSIWRTDELIIFSSPRHPLATKKRTTQTDLSTSSWILREQGSGTREIFEQTIANQLKALNVGYELGHTEAIKQAVKHDLGISYLSRLAVTEELNTGTLIELHTPFTKLQRPFYSLQHQSKYSTGPIACFTAFMNQQTKF